MRVPFLFSTFALASCALAQLTTGVGEVKIQQAMQSLRADSPLVFEMRGTDTTGRSTVAIHSVVYWRMAYDARTRKTSKAEVELDVYEPTPTGEQVTLRIVGDGTTLRRYDLVRREVTTTVYGFYGAIVPAAFAGTDAPLVSAQRLLSQLRAATPGSAAYLARLVSDMLPAGSDYGATYSNWMPGSTALSLMDILPVASGGTRQLFEVETNLDDAVPNPITGRYYTQGLSDWVTYNLNVRNPLRTLVFELNSRTSPTSGEMEPYIKQIHFVDRMGGRLRDLTIKPNSLAILPSYAFVPYSGAAAAAFTPLTRAGAG